MIFDPEGYDVIRTLDFTTCDSLGLPALVIQSQASLVVAKSSSHSRPVHTRPFRQGEYALVSSFLGLRFIPMVYLVGLAQDTCSPLEVSLESVFPEPHSLKYKWGMPERAEQMLWR